jgi:hypothetical protein
MFAAHSDGVFGVAVLALVFARPGAYTFPSTFVHGFTAALWVGAAFSAAGALAAALGSGRRALPSRTLAPTASSEPAFAEVVY